MTYLRYLALTILGIIMTITNVIFAPIIALFVRDGYLPRWLSWFSTLDNPCYGDKMFQEQQMAWTKSKYLYALFWLCRNPAYGFDHAIGANIPEGFFYESKGDEAVSNSPLHEGWVFRKVRSPSYIDPSVTYWQFYYVKKLTATKCLKLNLGWKLWGNLQAGQVRQLVCTVTPFAKVVM